MKALSGLESQIECFLEKFYVYGLRVIRVFYTYVYV